jgi:prepilin-type N-terminal cleavage/methylation domain-containing protein
MKKVGVFEVKKLIGRVRSNQKGFSLAEVVVAMAIFGVVGTSVMLALNASSGTIVSAHEITIAESVTRTTIEFIKRSDYDSTNTPPLYDTDSTDADAVDYAFLGLDGDPYYGDYAVDVNVERLDPQADGLGDDDGLQKITVTVTYHNRLVLTTEAYKVNR